MELTDPEAIVSISPLIPWYFAPGVIAVAIIVGIAITKGIAALFAFRFDRRQSRAGKQYAERKQVGGTFTALLAGAIAGVVFGVNYVPIWYFMNPTYASPEENEASVRHQFAEQSVDDVRLRDTEPRHSLERIDEQAWREEQPLTFLFACDAGQMPEAGQFPPYDRHEWDLPISYLPTGENERQAAVVERSIVDDQCVFTIRDFEADE